MIRKLKPEVAFYWDIPSQEKNPEPEGKKSRIQGIKIPRLKEIPNPEAKNPETKKNPESQGFSENPEKIPTVRKS